MYACRRRGLSAAQFREQYELPGVPVVLQGELDGWAAMRTWSEEHLERAYGFNPAVVGEPATLTKRKDPWAGKDP